MPAENPKPATIPCDARRRRIFFMPAPYSEPAPLPTSTGSVR
jgi:hypothetical protein